MPYPRRDDRLIRHHVAPQSTVPDRDLWFRNADEVERTRYDDEDYDWYLQNRGVMQPDGSYFGPEIGPGPKLDYDPSVRQVGQPMRNVEYYPGESDDRFYGNLEDLVLGYDPMEGAEGYEPEYDAADQAMFGAMFMPGRIGRTAGTLVGADIAYDIARGRRIPGAIDMTWLGGMGVRAARNAYRAGKAFKGGYQAGRARRAAEQAMKSRMLEVPKVRRQNARTGRWDEVDAYPEFTPYEEVR